MSVLALVLAAGAGRRFGSDKRLARLADGRGLLAASVERAQALFGEVWVVLREEDDPQALGLPPAVRPIRCADAALGMGHSLAAGARALREEPGEAMAVLLGDMPWVAPATLQALQAAASAERILFPLYRGERGHPVLFGRRFWGELEALHGDQGARAVLATHPQACLGLELDDPGVLRDVDEPQALIRVP
ncbi:nucleotidyltransferase family protein [Pseudomonas sp. CAU 1711]|uniref:nucleotidyltransferase family protein n=1 Tax=Pseudomonas sp. CAU 1711 TaxID=3140356 RepID=UPI003260DBCF